MFAKGDHIQVADLNVGVFYEAVITEIDDTSMSFNYTQFPKLKEKRSIGNYNVYPLSLRVIFLVTRHVNVEKHLSLTKKLSQIHCNLCVHALQKLGR